MDLTSELERSLAAPADEPPHRDLTGLLDHAHRSLRRRRLAVGGAVATLVLVAGLGAAAVLDGRPDASRSVATDPSPEPVPAGPPGPPYAMYAAGEIVLDAGVEELRRVDNPLGYAEPDGSVALFLALGDRLRWELVTWDVAGQSEHNVTVAPTEAEQTTFLGWVEVQQELYGGPEELVVLKGRPGEETLVPRVGVTIVEQVDQLSVGEVTPDGWTANVAIVDDAEGERWFALVRSDPESGEAQYFTYRQAETAVDSIVGFVGYVLSLADRGQFP